MKIARWIRSFTKKTRAAPQPCGDPTTNSRKIVATEFLQGDPNHQNITVVSERLQPEQNNLLKDTTTKPNVI